MRVGRIYKIIAINGHESYVGSTFNTIRDRFRKHQITYKRWKEGKYGNCSVFQLFEKYGPENCRSILIKEYEVEDRAHLEVYETLWIKKLKSINTREPCGRILKVMSKKKYRQNNSDKIKEQRKAYIAKNKELVRACQKSYNNRHEEKFKEYRKQYYSENCERIKERTHCECGAEIRRTELPRHRRTMKHSLNLMKQKINTP